MKLKGKLLFYTYEHWRTDLNVPFYVGKGDDVRISYIERNNDEHRNICAKLKRTGHKVEVKLPIATEIEAEAFDGETLIIETYREAGIELVNRTNGGEGVSGHKPTAEMLARQSAGLVAHFESEKGARHREINRAAQAERYCGENGDENRAATGKAVLEHHASPEGAATRALIGAASSERYNGPDGEFERYLQSLRMLERFNGENGEANREQSRKALLEHHASPEGQVTKDKIRAATAERFNGPNGEANREYNRAASRIAATERYNGPNAVENRIKTCIATAKISQDVAQAILDFKGTHADAARAFGVSYDTALGIRKRSTWRHLTPTAEG